MTNLNMDFTQRLELLAKLSAAPKQTLIGIAEVAALLDISPETVRRAPERNPKLIPPPLRNCSLLRWRLGDVLSSIDEQPLRK